MVYGTRANMISDMNACEEVGTVGLTHEVLETDAKTNVTAILITAADDATATATWERPVFTAPCACTVTRVGIVSATAFGQSTEYSTLTFTGKGAAGAGTDSMAAHAFSSAITALDFVDFGTVSNANLAALDTVTVKKTVTASGEVVTAYVIAIIAWAPR